MNGSSALFVAVAWEVVVAFGVGVLGGALATYRLFGPATRHARHRNVAAGKKGQDEASGSGSETSGDVAGSEAMTMSKYVDQLEGFTIHESKDPNYKLVLLVRQDLKMDKGKVAAQCSHATLLAYQQAVKRAPKFVSKWEENGQTKITLKVNDEEELLRFYKAAREAGLIASLIRDAGRTQIAAGSMTVLGIGPGPCKEIDRITSQLKLY